MPPTTASSGMRNSIQLTYYYDSINFCAEPYGWERYRGRWQDIKIGAKITGLFSSWFLCVLSGLLPGQYDVLLFILSSSIAFALTRSETTLELNSKTKHTHTHTKYTKTHTKRHTNKLVTKQQLLST